MSTFLAGFDGLWARSIDDYKEAVKRYLIVLDTNVLLELYRFTPQARHELLDVLAQLDHRLWVPHQVAREYHNRRFEAVREHLNLYTSVPDGLNTLRNKALHEVQNLAKRCSMNDADKQLLTAPINDAFDKVAAEIRRHSDAFDLSLAKVVRDDPILSALSRILDGKTGDPFSDEDSDALIAEFQERVAEQIPPGYRDAGKSENAHGDFFVWEQLLREAAQRQTPVLLVTNDVKDDWVKKEAGFVVGARPELLEEFKERCNNDLLMTQLPHFLGMAKEVLGAAVSQSTMQQAKNVRDSGSERDVLVTLPSRHFGPIYNYIATYYENHYVRADGSLSSEEEGAAEETLRILNSMKIRKRNTHGDVLVAIPLECFERFRHYVSVQSAVGGTDSEGPEREDRTSEYRLLMNELADLRGLLESARKERDMAIAVVAENERAARNADSTTPDAERERLAREAKESRRKLLDTASSIHDLEMQIHAISRQLDSSRSVN
ncbi:PIN domain-containing protein [Streptomyces cyaneogriseus]|uniref:PIN domain-containing protein n=1 Tax=Streptomyces cyaneogriseus TaxID=68192 RepID=UPI000A61FD28|nr:PIN domain-containing protein [Streptomyces cyaneogriseus]